jgi:hypothetical protein
MKGRQERRRKIRLWNPSEEDKKKEGRKKAIGATSRGIDLHVPQFNSNFHMIEAQIRSKMVIEQGKGKEKERDNCSTELEYYSLVHNIGCI